MHGRFALFLFTTSIGSAAVQAQTLNVRPAPFHDFRSGQPRHGEVVLGRTTLPGALRGFSELLRSDSVRVPRAHPGNPSSLPAGMVWQAGGAAVHPRHQLDLGPDRYLLYFDHNSRLVAAHTQRLPGELTRAMLSTRYPALRKGRRWYGGDRPRWDTWSVSLSDCVTLSTMVSIPGDRVEQLTYLYTCPTRPGAAP